MSREIATFAAGCFWGVEEHFRQLPGVISTSVGYTGGSKPRPTYKEVCTGRTGHAEAVQVVFDPEQISYDQLLHEFWRIHDPTQVNRQGPDVGHQYRSEIFTHSAAQFEAAQASKAALDQSKRYRRPVATEIQPASEFFLAEDYHQQYIAKRGAASCHVPQ
jgi:peptide-methionine (S)-S-oxide reductase